jgi:cytochrome c551/c552
MSRLLRSAGVVLLVGLVGAQLVRPARDNPPVTGDVAAPPDVQGLLRRACYDCHSHKTVWPWYAGVAPISWLVAHDVAEGREKLDFSTWNAYAPGKRVKKLRESAKEIAEGEMPPWQYTLVHPEARLSDAERARLLAWIADEVPAQPAAR